MYEHNILNGMQIGSRAEGGFTLSQPIIDDIEVSRLAIEFQKVLYCANSRSATTPSSILRRV